MPSSAKKIAILGGGIGSLTAAFELSEQHFADGSPKYEVTVYQMGWRLGGKMAAGRAGSNQGHRIEEHGIHGFMGSYYNAGTVMERVFEELRQIPNLSGFFTEFDDAFEAQNSAVRWEFINNRWLPWLIELKPNELKYGDLNPLDQVSFVVGFRQLLTDALDSLNECGVVEPLDIVPETLHHELAFTPENLEEVRKTARALMNLMASVILDPTNLPELKQKGPVLAHKIKGGFEVFRQAEWTWQFMPTDFRRVLIQIDYVTALLTGFFDDDIISNGYAYIDNWDFNDWLLEHGATTTTVWSPITLNSAAITYNFTDGDTTKGPEMSAGSYLQWSLSVYAYVGAFIWAFKAGSGESVLAPMYRLLVERKVKFKFFHKVTGLNLDRLKTSVSSVNIDVQAYVKGGKDYDPLIGPIRGLMCWPSEPRYDLLRKPATLKKQKFESAWNDYREKKIRLRAGRDYDHLILGISLGALKDICPKLINSNKKWELMVNNIETVPTQAMQLWFKEPVKNFTPKEIRFKYEKDLWVAGTYLMPISGQADFTSTLSFEDWPAGGPEGVLYMCGPMSDWDTGDYKNKNFPQEQYQRVRAQCIQYLESCAAPFLTGASTAGQKKPTILGSLDFERLYCMPDDVRGERRFDFQFWRANIEPSERYVTCQPGTAFYRLEAGDSGFKNLTLCGDWIQTGLNVGSVEGAMIGGRLASHAISNVPALDKIYGYEPFS